MRKNRMIKNIALKDILSCLLGTILILSLLVLIVPTISATVEEGVTTNPCDHGFIDFEEGTDRAVIHSTVPGVKFTTTAGQDWLYGDWRTGMYNGKYPNGAYTSNGNLWAWLGENQGYGRIDFTEGMATYLSLLTSTYSGVTIDAYDSNGNLLANSGWAGGNINTGKMTRLNVTAPGMAYVIIHDTGNYWLIDDICTDAHGVRGVNLDIYTDKTFYSPNERIIITARVTDAYGSCLYPLKKNNFKVSVDGAEAEEYDGRIEKAITWALNKVGSHNHDYECLKFVCDAYKYGAGSDPKRYGYAKEAANVLGAKDNTGVPPQGAFAFYDWWGTVDGIYKN